jgi:CheY-like chemotaxis protein
MKEHVPVVLLVEDDAEDRWMVERGFRESECNMRLVVVDNGHKALEYLRQQGEYAKGDFPQPDLIMLDLNLPVTDGATVLRDVKSDVALKTIPVIVFTTSGSAYDIQRCYELGANSYVRKPSDHHKFMAAISVMAQFWCGVATIPA